MPCELRVQRLPMEDDKYKFGGARASDGQAHAEAKLMHSTNHLASDAARHDEMSRKGVRHCRGEGNGGLSDCLFRQLLKLRRGISPHVVLAELAETPWQRTWWSQVLGFMHRLDNMDEGSFHLRDNLHDVLGNPGCLG